MKHKKHSEQGYTPQDQRAMFAAAVRAENAELRRAADAAKPHPIEVHITEGKSPHK